MIDIARTLYSGTRALMFCKSGGATVGVGRKGPTGQYLSNAHRTATTSGAYNCAKISYAGIVLEYLLSGRIAAVEGASDARVYTELSLSDGTVEQALCTQTAIHWSPSVPSQSGHILVPIVLYALQNNSEMTETKAAFKLCAADYTATGEITPEHMFLFCDAFYYEWKATHPTQIEGYDSMSEDIVKQAIRTRNLQRFELFDEISLVIPEVSIEAIPANTTGTSAPVSNDAQFKECRDGRYILDYMWEAERADHIPSLTSLEDFVPNETYFSLTNLIHSELEQVLGRMDEGEYGVKAIQDNYVNAIMVGKPGTGKTTLANALAATFGMPIYVVKADGNTEADQYEGMTKVADGGFRFVSTPFLDVYKNGGIILLEEFNLANQAVLMGTLGQAIEKPFILYEDGYKEVRRHPLCVIISTMNSGTEGSRLPNQAFTSRSPDVFMLDDPNESDFLAILKRRYKANDCKNVYRAYAKIVTYLCSSSVNAEDISLAVTMRHCFAALRQMKCGIKFKTAIRNTMIGAIAIYNLPLADMVYRAVVEPMRD